MTISTQQSAQIFLGNGVTTAFDFSFIGNSSSYITVTYTDADGTATTLTSSQYTISLNAAAVGALWGVGGTVTYPTMGSPIADGTSLTIARVLPLVQDDSISNQGAFAPSVIESALDTLEMQIQQTSTRNGLYRGTWVTGTLYNFNDSVVDGVNGTDTGNYYVCTLTNTSGTWATDLADGDWTLMIDVQSINDDVAAAAASAAAAATSASNASTSASSASTSAGSASSSAATATTQAGNASTSATNAASSASSASTSAATATTQAGNASTSATNAASSASSASTSATNAANSATAAAASAASISGGLSATSTSSVAIGTGAKTFTIQASKLFVSGQILIISSDASAVNYMHGTVTSYSGTTLVMNITDIGGSGTHTDWTISVSGTQGSGTVTNVTGTTDRITVATGTTTPVIDIASTYLAAVVNGGTGLAALTAHDLIIGNGTSAATLLAPSATSGVPLISQGASSNPAYGTAVVAGGGTGATTLTANNVILGNGTSTVQFVAPGTSGNVLTSNGTTWASAVATNPLILLSTQVASNSASIVFTSLITSTYTRYVVEIFNLITVTDAVNLLMTASIDNGSTYLSGTSYTYHIGTLSASSAGYAGNASSGTSSILISSGATTLGNSTGENYSASITLLNPSNATVYKNVIVSAGLFGSSAAEQITLVGGGGILTTSAVNAVKFAASSGNLSSGIFKLYGVL